MYLVVDVFDYQDFNNSYNLYGIYDDVTNVLTYVNKDILYTLSNEVFNFDSVINQKKIYAKPRVISRDKIKSTSFMSISKYEYIINLESPVLLRNIPIEKRIRYKQSIVFYYDVLDSLVEDNFDRLDNYFWHIELENLKNSTLEDLRELLKCIDGDIALVYPYVQQKRNLRTFDLDLFLNILNGRKSKYKLVGKYLTNKTYKGIDTVKLGSYNLNKCVGLQYVLPNNLQYIKCIDMTGVTGRVSKDVLNVKLYKFLKQIATIAETSNDYVILLLNKNQQFLFNAIMANNYKEIIKIENLGLMKNVNINNDFTAMIAKFVLLKKVKPNIFLIIKDE